MIEEDKKINLKFINLFYILLKNQLCLLFIFCMKINNLKIYKNYFRCSYFHKNEGPI